MRRKTMLALALVLVSSIALSTTAWGYTAERTVKMDFTLSSDGELILKNVNGRIRIIGDRGRDVELVAKIKVKARSRSKAEKALEHVEIDVDEDSDRLVIQTKLPKQSSSIFGLLFGKWSSASVDYELRVPRDLAEITARTVNGGIEVEDVGGTVVLRTTNGGIDVDNARGAVSARTVNGGMDIHLSSWDERESMEFTTVNGGIDLAVPENSDFDIDASVTNGHIETEFPVEVYGKISKRRLRGRVGEGGRLVEIHTTNGSVSIRAS
jgi:DUF4097 and DUF4098 domain-containing protein YvlB